MSKKLKLNNQKMKKKRRKITRRMKDSQEKQNDREKQSLKTTRNKYIKLKKMSRMQVLFP
jgi:hypothetical protein